VAMTAIDDPPDLKKMRWRAVTDLAFEYRGVFATAGIASITFMLMRAARTVLIPLLGAELGLETTVIGLVVSVSAIIDVALFYPAGMIMDRHGRRATAVPSSILFAAALAALSLANGFYSLLAVAIVLGVANGLSTGIVMTLGTDLAPAARRGEFLGLWRLLTDLGSAAGPLTVSLAVTLGSIQAAALCVGALGAAGSLVVYRFVEETLKR
ncbi:MAG: MFS transporter, partial [Gammaproteobacteria bacterium]